MEFQLSAPLLVFQAAIALMLLYAIHFKLVLMINELLSDILYFLCVNPFYVNKNIMSIY